MKKIVFVFVMTLSLFFVVNTSNAYHFYEQDNIYPFLMSDSYPSYSTDPYLFDLYWELLGLTVTSATLTVTLGDDEGLLDFPVGYETVNIFVDGNVKIEYDEVGGNEPEDWVEVYVIDVTSEMVDKKLILTVQQGAGDFYYYGSILEGTAIPLPSSMLLLGSGLLGLGLLGWRRKRG